MKQPLQYFFFTDKDPHLSIRHDKRLHKLTSFPLRHDTPHCLCGLPSFLPLNGFLLLLDHVCKLLEYRSKFHNGALNILHCVCPALDVRVLLKEKQQNFRQTFCSNDRVVILYLKQRVLHLYDWKYGILSINIQIPAHQWAEAARDCLESPCQWLRRPYSWTHPASGLSSLQRHTKQSIHTVAHARKGQMEIHTGKNSGTVQ